MKISIIYFSKTGNTAKMAEVIKRGMETEKNIEVRLFPLDNVDEEFVNDSKAVVFGTPTHMANTAWQIKKWLDESGSFKLEGKIGAVFATARYVQGGAEVALLTTINHLMVKGMLVYSGGSALGQPYTHLGAITLQDTMEENEEQFLVFGKRIATKVNLLF